MKSHNPNHRFSSKVAVETDLTRLVGLGTLHAMQDRFASLGQVTVCICTNDGDLITEPTWGSRYSAMVGTSEKGSVAMLASLRQLAADPNGRAPSVCHEGLTLHAAPVVGEQGHVGMIVAGTRPPQPPTRDQIALTASRFDIDAQKLADTIDYAATHTGATPEAVRRFADTMAETIATIYTQSRRIRQQLADLSIVHDLANALSERRNLDDVLDLTVKRVVEIMPVKACGIRLLNAESDELEVRAVCNLSEEYLAKGPVLLSANVIDTEAFSGTTVYIRNAQEDPRIRYPENARREGIVSGLCVPMTYHAETVGVLRVYTGEAYEFSGSECALLRSIGSQAAAAVINSRFFDERVATERFQRQVKAAGEIQRRMLPSANPDTAHFEFGCVFVPSLELGGDFYDLIEREDGSIGIAVADVVGKGLPAALMMASVRSAVRVSSNRHADVAESMAIVNRHMCRETEISEFATMLYGVLAADGSHLAFGNAGHFPPLLLRDGEVKSIGDSGLVVGILPDVTYDEMVVELQPGDVLMMYTDGVAEALDYDGEQFGQDRVYESMKKHSELSAEQLARQVLWDVRRFAGLARQSDDITIVVVRRR
ncbi:MAG: SpoIIE family protein phosphatase [Planctomycetota bacterium]